MKRYKNLIRSLGAVTGVIALLASLSSCSAVFTASVTGSVIDKDSWEKDGQEVGIGDVEIFLYNDKDAWTSDYTAWTEEGTRPDTVADGEDPNFFLSTVSAQDGTFTFNGLIWNKLFPAYGKSGDRAEIYFLFYNSDYGVSSNPAPIMIVSDVTNRLAPIKLARITNSATVQGNVINKSTRAGVGAVNVNLYVATALDPLTFPDAPDYQTTTAADGSYSSDISFSKDLGDTVQVKITVDRNNYDCEAYDGDGSPAGDYVNAGPVEKDRTYTVADIEIKQTEFNETLDGRVWHDDGNGTFDTGTDYYVNGVTVWLFFDNPSTLQAGDVPEQSTFSHSQSINNSTVEDGHFSFTGIQWTDTSYSGDYSTKVCYLYRPTAAEISSGSLDAAAAAAKIDQYTLRSNGDNYIEIIND